MFWHPSENDLALAATNDAAPWKSGMIRRHVAKCAACASAATAYAELSRDVQRTAAAAAQAPVPPFAADAIIARIRRRSAADATEAARPWFTFPLGQVGIALGLVVLAILLVRWPSHRGPAAPQPVATNPSFSTPARAEAVLGAKAASDGRGRVIVYGSPRRGRAEVSATGGAVGVVQADAATGTLTITAVSVEE